MSWESLFLLFLVAPWLTCVVFFYSTVYQKLVVISKYRRPTADCRLQNDIKLHVLGGLLPTHSLYYSHNNKWQYCTSYSQNKLQSRSFIVMYDIIDYN